ncbi:MAG: hypothetical protein ACJ73D_08295 [Pyrinomonadaceae bacterium]
MERVHKLNGRVVCVACLLALVAACSGGNKQLSKTDIQLAAGDLRSFAASTQMLVEECTARRATETFCQEQAELLSNKVEDALRELKGQGGPAENERQQLSDIGVRLREIVVRVEQSASVLTDAADAERLANTAKTLEDGLRR